MHMQAYAEIWRPLPVSYEATQQSAALGRHLISQSAIFPRLRSDLEVCSRLFDQGIDWCGKGKALGGIPWQQEHINLGYHGWPVLVDM
jgi:hypothetical protein